MNPLSSRREFLADVGRGVLIAAVGHELATDLGLSKSFANDQAPVPLNFGPLERLVCVMQETAPDKIIPKLVEELRAGRSLRELTAAGALANARTFGGEDYIGFHTMMALAPAFHLSVEMPSSHNALPVLKVLYRNTNRIQERGGRKSEVLFQVEGAGETGGAELQQAIRNKDLALAEKLLAGTARESAQAAFDQVVYGAQDTPEVHRVVLPYRAWDLLGLIGKEHAYTLLRQSVHYCVKAESWPQNYRMDDSRVLLPKLMDEHGLLGRARGTKEMPDEWIGETCETIFKSSAEQAARLAAAALAQGVAPDDLGEAISLAANQLVLRDRGRTVREEVPGKPVGSVHGDSIGVHACDSANAWRHMASIGNTRNTYASLILGAYQVAHDRMARGGDFLTWDPLPISMHVDAVRTKGADDLLLEADEAIRGNLQARASAIVHRYGQLGHPAERVFDLLRKYAVSEDGALHAEKFYRTVREEFAESRAVYRWRHLVALARVTASEYGRPANGIAEAKALLKV
jgi:hypothetical protein